MSACEKQPNQSTGWETPNVLLLLTLVSLLLALGYLASYWQRTQDAEVQWYAADAACDLQRGPCSARLPGEGEIRLAITPRAIKPLEPLALEVRVAGLAARQVAVDFQGRDMYMGLNQFPLSPVATMDTGVFRGSGMLSVCSDQRMTWRARVLITTAQGTLGTWFDFEVERHEG